MPRTLPWQIGPPCVSLLPATELGSGAPAEVRIPGSFPRRFCVEKIDRDCNPPLCVRSRGGIHPKGLASIALNADVRRERKGERNDESPVGAENAVGQGRCGRGYCGVLVHQRYRHDRRNDRRRDHACHRRQRRDCAACRSRSSPSPSSSPLAARTLVVVLVVG